MEKQFGFIIKVYAGEYPTSGVLEFHKWSGYKFEQFIRWKWYFEYRTALLRVKYPRNRIDSYQFDEPLNTKTQSEILKNKISAQKAKVSKYRNAIRNAEKHWNQLFPISDNEFYQQVICKLKLAESDLQNLENQSNFKKSSL